MQAMNTLKLDPVPSFKLKGMMEGGKTDSPTSEALLKKERKFPPQPDATLSMGTVKLFIGGLFLAFVLGALVTGTAMHLASGSSNIQYLGARSTEFASGSCVWTASGYHCSALPSDLSHGRHLAATCNQFNVAVSGTTFKGTQKMGDSTVGIWEAIVTNQCATGPLTSLTVSTDGRYNPAGGANPRSQTGLQNCSPPTVDKNGVLHGPVTCAVVLPAGGLAAAQSMTVRYLDNNVAGPAAHTFAVGAAVYAVPVPAPTAGAACNQFNVAVSPTTFHTSTKVGDSTVGIWQATITNKCAGLPLTSAAVTTDGRYNPAGGVDPRSQTGLQNCSSPTVDKNGVIHGPVTCQVALPGGSLGAGQSFTFTYVDNNLAGAYPAHTFAVSSAVYGTPAGTQTQTQTQAPAAVNCNQFNVAVAPTAFTGVSKIGGGQVGNWQATITNQCAADKLTSLTVTTSGRFNPAGGIPRSTTNLANCTPPTVDKQGNLHGPVTCQVVLPGGALGAGQSMTVTYTDNNLGSAAAFNFATGAAAYAAA